MMMVGELAVLVLRVLLEVTKSLLLFIFVCADDVLDVRVGRFQFKEPIK